MRARRDLIGQEFGRVKVVAFRSMINAKRFYDCYCSRCHTTTIIPEQSLKRGKKWMEQGCPACSKHNATPHFVFQRNENGFIDKSKRIPITELELGL